MLLESKKSEVDAPPPYYLQSASASGSVRSTRSRAPSILPPLPPEAYALSEPRPSHPKPHSSFTQINLETRSEDITGTYYVDPQKPGSELTNKKSKKARKKKAAPDASFRSRSARIAIDLGTTGFVHDAPKASVVVVSKSGTILLNLLPAEDETKPRFDLDIESNSGTVAVFIPKTYGGAIQLYTKSGTFEFLPALSQHLNVVKARDTESLVLFGKQVPPSSQLPSDFCQIRTRSGKIIVGLSGEDTYVEEIGLWKRIGEFFKGDHSTPSTRPPSPH
ncbi:hypothetical protein R3P38DRAFT_3087320 [Favolaschia claudopus]|uniref:DUF7330 domain-containing protein n=1 Tax=Favolaschia claudopus TaxID=2862362 RepID=A0AAV9ZUL8_9AGAR